MKRLFFAVSVTLSPSFTTHYLNLQKMMSRDDIVWVKPDFQHLTLRFLGPTPDNHIDQLLNTMSQVAQESERFNLELNKLGVFGSKYAPTVLWYGFNDFSKFKDLFLKLEPLLNSMGFDPNYGNFVPHLTIGRIKKIENKRKFTEIVTQNQPIFSQEIPVQEIQLIRSKLSSDGPKYTVLERFPLQ
jgi:RNA 2',3'-cyclic 3'-phosphodiesterase